MRRRNLLDHFHNSCGLDLSEEFHRRRNKGFTELLKAGRGGEKWV